MVNKIIKIDVSSSDLKKCEQPSSVLGREVKRAKDVFLFENELQEEKIKSNAWLRLASRLT
jgi:hypothetical protein